MKVMILYMRISVEDREKTSISNQRALLHAFVEKQSEFAGCQVVELCDDGCSGTNMKRPAIMKLMKMVKAGQVDCIIVKDFSRFGRDYLTVSDYVEQIFPLLGIRFISVNDHYDSASTGAAGNIDRAFRNVIYGYYSQDLSVKVKSGKRTKAQKGDYVNPYAPFGYQKSPENNNQLIIEPIGAEIVKKIFRLAGEGVSALYIACQLNTEQVITPSERKKQLGIYNKMWAGVGDEKRWTNNMITRILRDERYLGKNIYGKRARTVVGDAKTKKQPVKELVVVENCHEPLVTKEEFNEANQMLKKKVERNKTSAEKHIFHGKLRCGQCGYALSRSNVQTPRFYCTTQKMRQTDCMKGHIKEKDLSEIVLAMVYVYILLVLDSDMVRQKEDGTGLLLNLQEKLSSMQHRITAIKEQKARLYDRLLEQEITREQFCKKQEVLSGKQVGLEQQYKQVQTQMLTLEQMLHSNTIQEQVPVKRQGMLELTRERIEAWIDCIYVYDSRSIQIQWRFSFFKS